MYMHRGKKIRVFLFGDYEFECHMVGITGAQGPYNYMSVYERACLHARVCVRVRAQFKLCYEIPCTRHG